MGGAELCGYTTQKDLTDADATGAYIVESLSVIDRHTGDEVDRVRLPKPESEKYFRQYTSIAFAPEGF
ncbi:hypothetical protein CARG_09185 [Corynebacterium argentoratense DSM 44202]|uniref:Uncharacterized protein n=1 Tax=Corynebacterium argentoratense DSM 44202 TaxID=1348662 RepID=U3GYS0_9CORY|nr:hypothetical protein CARG_09185 [Corynebacterium argentoratense DSM 44202]